MSLRQIRNRVDALKRKLAVPLAVVRLRPLADEFCREWAQARANFGSPNGPSKPMLSPGASVETETLPFIRRIASHGFRLPTFIGLHKYLEHCRAADTLPECYEIIRRLLPQPANGVIRAILRSDALATS